MDQKKPGQGGKQGDHKPGKTPARTVKFKRTLASQAGFSFLGHQEKTIEFFLHQLKDPRSTAAVARSAPTHLYQI